MIKIKIGFVAQQTAERIPLNWTFLRTVTKNAILFSKRKFHLSAAKIRVGKLFALKFVIKMNFHLVAFAFRVKFTGERKEAQKSSLFVLHNELNKWVLENKKQSHYSVISMSCQVWSFIFKARLWNWTWYQFKLINYMISCVRLLCLLSLSCWWSFIRRKRSRNEERHKRVLWRKSLKSHKL